MWCALSLDMFFFFSFFFFLFCSLLASCVFSRMETGSCDDVGGEEVKRKKKDASDRLLRACEDGDVEAAREAITDGAHVSACEGEDKWFPLMYAALPNRGNSVEIVQMLID